MWNCIEERETDPLGRIQRKLIFTEIYENEHYAKGKISIPKEIDIQVFFQLKKIFNQKFQALKMWQIFCKAFKFTNNMSRKCDSKILELKNLEIK